MNTTLLSRPVRRLAGGRGAGRRGRRHRSGGRYGLPGPRCHLRATSTTPGTIDVDWTAPTGAAPDDYRVRWARSGESWPSWRDAAGNLYPTTSSQRITDLDEGVTYKIEVRARYRAAAGAAHGRTFATTPPVLTTDGQAEPGAAGQTRVRDRRRARHNPWATPWGSNPSHRHGSTTTRPSWSWMASWHSSRPAAPNSSTTPPTPPPPPSSSSTATRRRPGSCRPGLGFRTIDDVDWYRVELEQDIHYLFETADAPVNHQDLRPPALNQLQHPQLFNKLPYTPDAGGTSTCRSQERHRARAATTSSAHARRLPSRQDLPCRRQHPSRHHAHQRKPAEHLHRRQRLVQLNTNYRIVWDVACRHEGIIEALYFEIGTSVPFTYAEIERETDGSCTGPEIRLLHLCHRQGSDFPKPFTSWAYSPSPRSQPVDRTP